MRIAQWCHQAHKQRTPRLLYAPAIYRQFRHHRPRTIVQHPLTTTPLLYLFYIVHIRSHKYNHITALFISWVTGSSTTIIAACVTLLYGRG